MSTFQPALPRASRPKQRQRRFSPPREVQPRHLEVLATWLEVPRHLQEVLATWRFPRHLEALLSVWKNEILRASAKRTIACAETQMKKLMTTYKKAAGWMCLD